jgi:transcriptional regulator with XRE-family HTH domain
MQAVTFETLRELVMHYAARRGWRTQRHIAVVCGFDESGLSRFLNGEQDIGARRTHALFQAVGIPVEQYDLAYSLLGAAQEQARVNREAWLARRQETLIRLSDGVGGPKQGRANAIRSPSSVAVVQAVPSPMPIGAVGSICHTDDSEAEIPASVVIAKFREERLNGAEIAAFFDGRSAAA